MADQLKAWVDCGVLKLGGTRTSGGRTEVALTGTEYGLTASYWVDISTYLPDQETDSFGSDQEHVMVQTSFQWLPATPDNLEKLTVQIPADFTQVSPPALSD